MDQAKVKLFFLQTALKTHEKNNFSNPLLRINFILNKNSHISSHHNLCFIFYLILTYKFYIHLFYVSFTQFMFNYVIDVMILITTSQDDPFVWVKFKRWRRGQSQINILIFVSLRIQNPVASQIKLFKTTNYYQILILVTLD